MKGLAITSGGIEDIAAMEISELVNTTAKTGNTCVIFTIKELRELCIIAYKAQSIDRVLLLLDSFKVGKDFMKDAEKSIITARLDGWLKDKRYVVRCIREGTHEFTSVDVESGLGRQLHGKFKQYNCKIDFDNPEVILMLYIVDEDCYFGIDFSGFELNKRPYKIFANSSSLRATIAYSLVRLGSFGKKDVFLDPFTGDGVIAIEAALYATGFSANNYRKEKFIFSRFNFMENGIEAFFSGLDKEPKTESEIFGYDSLFKNVDAARKNARIAGINDFINLSRTSIEWLDVKFKAKSVDRIVTKLPSIKDKKDEKLLNDFFYQSEYVLRDDGLICLAAFSKEKVEECAVKNKFMLKDSREVYSGKQRLRILRFVKSCA